MNLEIIKHSIDAVVKLSDKEWTNLKEILKEKRLSKNELLLLEGSICGFIAFINYGSLIYFKLLENGNEVTTDFAFAGEWVTDNFSRLSGVPSTLNIRALEDTSLIILSNSDLAKVYEGIPKLEKVGRILIEQAFMKITQHSIDLQVLTATERYVKLIDKYPEILQKIPLHHIANYLGIAPKSLSRIRKEIT